MQEQVVTRENTTLIQNVFGRLRDRLNEIIVGQELVIDQILVSILADGHVLLEGVPGTAKTLVVKTIASLIGSQFSRIQLTPDMLPSDILGTSIYDLTTKTFALKRGPIFTSFLLADEINRTPPKTQSALLEAMEERQVSLEGETQSLPELFLVVATQNPIEFEGTYPLPEAQLDRFMFKILMGYPNSQAEKTMLKNWQDGHYSRYSPKPDPITDVSEVLACREALRLVKVEDSVINYLQELVEKSRNMSDLSLGASPRSALLWLGAAKAHAAIDGKDFVTPDNIKFVAEPVLRHRLILTPEAELEGITIDQIINKLMKQVTVPR